MLKKANLLRTLMVGFMAALFVIQSAGIADAQTKRRKTQNPTLPFFNRLEKCQKSYEEDEIREAAKCIAEMREKEWNPVETGQLLSFWAAIQYDLEKPGEALKAYEGILALGEQVPLATEQSAVLNAAQLHIIAERYGKGIDLLNRWFAYEDTVPGPQQYVIRGQAYFQQENFRKAIEDVEKAVELSQERGEQPRENWYLLLNSAYFQLENLPKVREVLRILVTNWGKPQYWKQLASVEGNLNGEQGQRRQFALYEVIYELGFFDKASELRQLSQFYLYNQVPIKATWVLEKAMKDGIIEKNAESYELLGSAYFYAQEYGKALDPLEKAAKATGDGDLWAQVAQIYNDQGKIDDAIRALQESADDDDRSNKAQTHLQLISLYVNKKQFSKASAELRKADRAGISDKIKRQYTAFIAGERRRFDYLNEV